VAAYISSLVFAASDPSDSTPAFDMAKAKAAAETDFRTAMSLYHHVSFDANVRA